MRRHSRRTLGGLALTFTAGLVLGAFPVASAAADTRPGIGEAWPMCGTAPDTDGKYCVVARTENGVPITHPASGLYQLPYIDLIGPGDVRFGVENYQDGVPVTVDDGHGGLMVDGDISPDDVYSVTVNTGDIVPRELYGHLRNVTYTTGGDASTGYTFTMTFQATPFAWLDPAGPVPCTVDACGNDTTVADWVYDGFVTGYVTDLADWPADQRDLMTGFVNVYNAQDAGLVYDFETNSLVVRMANAHLSAPGHVATGSYQTFLPNAMLTEMLSVPDPASLTGGSFVVSRTTGGTPTPVPFTITHTADGVALEIPDITFSTPTYRIKPKRTAPGAPRLRALERVTPTAVRLRFRTPLADGGAPVTLYRAACTPFGGQTVRSSGTASPITVGGVGRHAVTCTVRAVNRIGAGPWSATRTG